MLVDNNTEMAEPNEKSGGSSFLSPKVTNGVYVAYGIFVLLMSAFRLLKESYFDPVPGLEKQVGFLYHLYGMSCSYLFYPMIGLLVSYGLITRRRWARYGVIAAMLTMPVTLPLLLMVYGPLFTKGEILFQALLAILIIVVFVRFPLRQDTGKKFRARSFAALLVLVIFALSVRPLFTPLYLKYKSGEPLFIPKAKTIVIDPEKYQAEYATQRKIETPTVSYYVPDSYQIFSIGKNDNSFSLSLLNHNKDGLIILGKIGWGERYFKTREFERMGITNGLAYERFLYRNNFNPGAITLRALSGAKGGTEFYEFSMGELNGSVRTFDNIRGIIQELSLYGKDGRLVLGGTIGFYPDDREFGEHLTRSIISSVEVSPPVKNAAEYYKSGLGSYKKSQMEDAQFAFAQAYFQTPNNPEYAYMLVKSLMTEKLHLYNSMKRILEGSLKANPGNGKLKNLLEEIEAKDKEDNK
jgi:hypothetical protein